MEEQSNGSIDSEKFRNQIHNVSDILVLVNFFTYLVYFTSALNPDHFIGFRVCGNSMEMNGKRDNVLCEILALS